MTKIRTPHKITNGKLAGWTLRVGPRGAIQARGNETSTWGPAPLRLLTREYPTDDPVWVWLREHGAVRQSPSGPSGGATQPEAERRNVQVLLRLAPEVAERLRELATESGVTASAWVAARVIKS